MESISRQFRRHHRCRPSRSPPPLPVDGLPARRTREYPVLGYGQVWRCAWTVDKSIYSAEYQQLCALLRELRQEAGLTQVQVARLLDEPQSFVSKYESGERRLDVIELRLVATALRTSLQAIVNLLEANAHSPKTLDV